MSKVNAKVVRKTKKRIRKLCGKWISPLGLGWWERVDFIYNADRTYFQKKEDSETLRSVCAPTSRRFFAGSGWQGQAIWRNNMEDTLTYLTKYPPLTILVALLIVNSPAIFRLAGRWAEYAFPRWAETKKRRALLRETAQKKVNGERRDIVVLLKELLRENREQLGEAREDFNRLAQDVAVERQGYVHQMATLFERNEKRDARFTDAMLSMVESIQSMTGKMDKLCTLWEVYQARFSVWKDEEGD